MKVLMFYCHVVLYAMNEDLWIDKENVICGLYQLFWNHCAMGLVHVYILAWKNTMISHYRAIRFLGKSDSGKSLLQIHVLLLMDIQHNFCTKPWVLRPFFSNIEVWMKDFFQIQLYICSTHNSMQNIDWYFLTRVVFSPHSHVDAARQRW